MPAAKPAADGTPEAPVPVPADQAMSVVGDAAAPGGSGQPTPEPVTATPLPPVTPNPDPVPAGKVRLFLEGLLSHVHVDKVTITREGTDVDPETARRAHEAAALSGLRIREERGAERSGKTSGDNESA
jgi:hypothetical protein